MTESFGLILRIVAGEPTARPVELREQLEGAAGDFKMPIRPHAEGIEFHASDLPAAERLRRNPDLNREGSDLIIDAGPTASNMPPLG
jgi:hypothetical protein